MAVTLEQTIDQKQHSGLSLLLTSQAFWVTIALILACLYLSWATNAFATPQNFYNITRNFTFTAIIALGMTMVIITGVVRPRVMASRLRTAAAMPRRGERSVLVGTGSSAAVGAWSLIGGPSAGNGPRPR